MSHKNTAIADALMKTSEGKTIVFEAQKAIRPRFQELDKLAYCTYVSAAPSNHYHLYRASQKQIRDLASVGGEAYDKALLSLKLAWVDRSRFETAGKILVPDQKIRAGLGYRW